MKKLVYLIALVSLCFLFSSCVTLRLERRLEKITPVIANWYEHHSVLMQTKIPKWIDERGGREKVHFLRLPQELQVAYIAIFWKIRTEGAREEYYTRMAAAGLQSLRVPLPILNLKKINQRIIIRMNQKKIILILVAVVRFVMLMWVKARVFQQRLIYHILRQTGRLLLVRRRSRQRHLENFQPDLIESLMIL